MEDDGSGCSGSDVESSDSTQRFQLITQILHFVSQTRTETKMSNPKIQIYPDLNFWSRNQARINAIHILGDNASTSADNSELQGEGGTIVLKYHTAVDQQKVGLLTGQNIIFDILEFSAFQKYGSHMLSLLSILSLSSNGQLVS